MVISYSNIKDGTIRNSNNKLITLPPAIYSTLYLEAISSYLQIFTKKIGSVYVAFQRLAKAVTDNHPTVGCDITKNIRQCCT